MSKQSQTSPKGIRFAGIRILLGLTILFSMLIIVDRDRFFGGSETTWVKAHFMMMYSTKTSRRL